MEKDGKYNKLEVYIKNLKESSDPIYGNGFRYVFAQYEMSGWRGIINNVIKFIM